MKKVLILFGKSRWDKSKPFSNKKYMYSYEYFYTLCKENGIQIYRASYQWYDYKKKVFKYAWGYEKSNGGWKRHKQIRPDLVYDKTKAVAEAYLKNSLIRNDYPFFNSMEFSKIVDNKLAIGLLFPEWSKKSHVVKDNKHFAAFLKHVPENKRMVLKPINLSGGENVLIGTALEVKQKINQDKIKISDWIVQDFIDSSDGIPGVMTGVHDLRVVIINDKISYAYYRKPAEGSLLANLAQGGSMAIVPLKKLPSTVIPIIKKANLLFSGFEHKIYALDLMFDENKKPWIVELNSMPGMYFAPGQEETRSLFYKNLLDTFDKILN